MYYGKAVASYNSEDYDLTIDWMEQALETFIFESKICRLKCENSIDLNSTSNLHQIIAGIL